MTADREEWPQDRLIGPTILQTLAPRPAESHKNDFGAVGLLGGSQGMTGALVLSARAALYLGAGKIYAASLYGDIRLDMLQPELMWLEPAQLLTTSKATVLAAGPGLGTSALAVKWLSVALQKTTALVLDADALNLLAVYPQLQALASARTAPTLLTPHPGEAAQLLDCSIADIQSDRPAAALRLAENYRACVVLKGAGSICAAPDGNWRINPTGNPGLSSPGTGDVLTGMVAALLAQGQSSFTALQLAVYLHGAAADSLLMQGLGPIGLTASEISIEARRLLNKHVSSEWESSPRRLS